MSQEKIFALIPYAGALGISLGLLLYVWTWKKAQGAASFFWYLMGQTLYISGNILEMAAVNLNQKLFWESFQWIIASIPIIALPVFVTIYTEYRIRNRKRLFTLSLIFPIIFSLLVLTEKWNGLIYQNPKIIESNFFSSLVYDFSPLVITYSIYSYFVGFVSCAGLVYHILKPHSLYRQQTAFILAGIILPIAGSFLALAGIDITSQRDASPFTATIGNLLFAWGLFKFRIFKVIPIARENVFEALADPVVILDNRNTVVDVNSAMLALLDKTANDVIGESAKKVFDNFPIPIKIYTDVSYARVEAAFTINRKQIHYELTICPLYNHNRQMTGRIYISHDITALKELEGELRKLNTQLEDRVETRTRELAETYEQMLEGLARALELRDRETDGHSRRVTEMALKIAIETGVTGNALEDIRSGSILHDIGKISIPDEILHKKGPLTPEERTVINQHPETAYTLLSRIPFLSKAIEIPYCHHEKWDGTGYPRGLAGRDIPASARIFAIADVWDALSYDRSYNKAWSREKIIEHLKEQAGKHFDPDIMKVFLSMVEKGEI